MLLAVYKNKKYKTISVPFSSKDEIEKLLRENNIRWYTMSWSEGEKQDVKFLEECN